MMANIGAIKKIRSDWRKAQQSPIPGITTQPIGESNDDIFHWTGSMMGPEGSPYEGGIFDVDIVLPRDYPFKPPLCRFTTKLFHPNISPEAYHPIDRPDGGKINVDILKQSWGPALTIPTVVLSIQSLLTDPNPDDTLNPEASDMLRRHDHGKYNDEVREWVRQYATPQAAAAAQPAGLGRYAAPGKHVVSASTLKLASNFSHPAAPQRIHLRRRTRSQRR
jgi:ubiquitin-conjugating enzyme E2 D